MIKTKNNVIIALPNRVKTQPQVIYSRVEKISKDFFTGELDISYSDFYKEDDLENTIRTGTYSVSKELYNQLLATVGAIDSYEKELSVIDQAHVLINNQDTVYGTNWEVA